MNFVDVTVDGTRRRARRSRRRLSRSRCRRRLPRGRRSASGRTLIAGFRPEHLDIGDGRRRRGRRSGAGPTSSSTSATRSCSTCRRRARTSSRSSARRHRVQPGRHPDAARAARQAPPVRHRERPRRSTRQAPAGAPPEPETVDWPSAPGGRSGRRLRETRSSSRRVLHRGPLPDVPGRHHRASRRLASPRARSSATRARSRSSPSTTRTGSCSSASGGRPPAGRCSRSRPGTLDVVDRAPARSRTPPAPRRASSRRRPATGPDRGGCSASFWTAPGFATELMYLYLATDLRPGRQGPPRPRRGRAPRARAPALARGRVDRREPTAEIARRQIDRRACFWLARLRERPDLA